MNKSIPIAVSILGIAVIIGFLAVNINGTLKPTASPQTDAKSQPKPIDNKTKPEPTKSEPKKPEDKPSKYLDGTTIVHKSLRKAYFVSVIFNEGGNPYVYFSSSPKVQKLSHEEYLKLHNKLLPPKEDIIYTPPNPEYNSQEVQAMKAKADSLLGTPHRVFKLKKGMTNTEFVANVLNAVDRNKFDPEKATPDDFCKKKSLEMHEDNQNNQ
jgi:hypothetical protein